MMATATKPSKGGVLNSWKEIASYLGRGVRTVQRWERDLGLPVRRPRGTSRSAVIALTAEIDEWLRITPKNALRSSSPEAPLPSVVKALRKSVEQTAGLRQLCHELRTANVEAMNTLIGTLQCTLELVQTVRQSRQAFAREYAATEKSGNGSSRPN